MNVKLTKMVDGQYRQQIQTGRVGSLPTPALILELTVSRE